MFLVGLARESVDEYVKTETRPSIPSDASPKLWEKSGVFVTLNVIEGRSVRLRGCIGRPYPTQPLIEATVDSAIDAAVHDPRFTPVSPGELDKIIVDLSVLTPPRKLEYSDPNELLELVKVGRDGLIASRRGMRGLLLPQVALEYGWGSKTFLEHTCNKAGFPKDLWEDSGTEFMSFQAEIFGEATPHGQITRNPDHTRC